MALFGFIGMILRLATGNIRFDIFFLCVSSILKRGDKQLWSEQIERLGEDGLPHTDFSTLNWVSYSAFVSMYLYHARPNAMQWMVEKPLMQTGSVHPIHPSVTAYRQC